MGKRYSSYRSVVRDIISMPFYREKPIYGKPQEYWSSGNAISESDKALSQDIDWRKYTAQINNSPSNVRRLFISKDILAVQHYAPVKGVKYTSKNALVWGIKTTDFIKAMGYDGVQEDTSNIFQEINGRWKYANIEEIYIDELIKGSQSSVTQLKQYAHEDAIPRLRAVHYVPRLGNQVQGIIRGMDKGEDPSKVAQGVVVVYKQVPKLGRFSVRPGDYIFDREGGQLAEYGRKVQRQEEEVLKEAKKAAIQKKYSQVDGKEEKGKLEQIMDKLEEDFIREILFDGFSTKQRKEVIDGFTEQGKEKYSSLLGIDREGVDG